MSLSPNGIALGQAFPSVERHRNSCEQTTAGSLERVWTAGVVRPPETQRSLNSSVSKLDASPFENEHPVTIDVGHCPPAVEIVQDPVAVRIERCRGLEETEWALRRHRTECSTKRLQVSSDARSVERRCAPKITVGERHPHRAARTRRHVPDLGVFVAPRVAALAGHVPVERHTRTRVKILACFRPASPGNGGMSGEHRGR